MFRNPLGHPTSVMAYNYTPVVSCLLLSPRLRWAHLDSNHDTENRLHNTKPNTSNRCQDEDVSFDIGNGNQDDYASFDIGNGNDSMDVSFDIGNWN